MASDAVAPQDAEKEAWDDMAAFDPDSPWDEDQEVDEADLEHVLKKPSDKRRNGQLAAAVLLLLALPAQWLWHQWPAWKQDPQMRPWMQSLCDVLGCRLPQLVDVGSLEIVDRLLAQDQEVPHGWHLELLFRNQAPFAQPFPVLEITTLDAAGNVVAARQFQPSEYLSEDQRTRTIPAGAKAHVALDMVIDSDAVSGYEIRFASPDRHE